MKRSILGGICCIATVLTVLTGCSSKAQDPYRQAVESGLMAKNPEVKSIYFKEFEKTDSITVRKQIEMCIDVFELRKDAYQKKAEEYRAKNKPKLAAEKQAEADKSASLIAEVLKLKEAREADLDRILYYCYRFSGTCSFSNGSKQNIKDWYATVTPDGRSFNIQEGAGGLLKGMGRALEGYDDIIGNATYGESGIESGAKTVAPGAAAAGTDAATDVAASEKLGASGDKVVNSNKKKELGQLEKDEKFRDLK